MVAGIVIAVATVIGVISLFVPGMICTAKGDQDRKVNEHYLPLSTTYFINYWETTIQDQWLLRLSTTYGWSQYSIVQI